MARVGPVGDSFTTRADQFLLGHAKGLAGDPIRGKHPAVGRGCKDRVDAVVKQRAMLGFALPKRALGLLLLGDVANVAAAIERPARAVLDQEHMVGEPPVVAVLGSLTVFHVGRAGGLQTRHSSPHGRRIVRVNHGLRRLDVHCG